MEFQCDVDVVAVQTLKLALSISGLTPIDDYERREYGPHVVWTVCATAPQAATLDQAALEASLQSFLDRQNLGVRLGLHDLQIYKHPWNTSIYVSITLV